MSDLDIALSDIKEMSSDMEDITRAARRLPPINADRECLIAVYIRNLQDKLDAYKKVVEAAAKLSTDENSTAQVDYLVIQAMEALEMVKTF